MAHEVINIAQLWRPFLCTKKQTSGKGRDEASKWSVWLWLSEIRSRPQGKQNRFIFSGGLITSWTTATWLVVVWGQEQSTSLSTLHTPTLHSQLRGKKKKVCFWSPLSKRWDQQTMPFISILMPSSKWKILTHETSKCSAGRGIQCTYCTVTRSHPFLA